LANKSCPEIIAEFGFHPKAVEDHPKNFLSLKNCDILELSETLMRNYNAGQDQLLFPFVEKIKARKYLTNNEQISFEVLSNIKADDRIQKTLKGQGKVPSGYFALC
jgi:hypothetical protein